MRFWSGPFLGVREYLVWQTSSKQNNIMIFKCQLNKIMQMKTMLQAYMLRTRNPLYKFYILLLYHSMLPIHLQGAKSEESWEMQW